MCVLLAVLHSPLLGVSTCWGVTRVGWCCASTVDGSALVKDKRRSTNSRLPHHFRQAIPYHPKMGDSMIKTRPDSREFGETTNKARKRKAASLANKQHIDDSNDAFQPAKKVRKTAAHNAVPSTSQASGGGSRVSGRSPLPLQQDTPLKIQVSSEVFVRMALDHIQDDMVDQMRLHMSGYNLTNLAKDLPKMRVAESALADAGN